MVFKMRCKICENEKLQILERINKKDLIKLYKKFTQVDFSYLINQDIDYCECPVCKLLFFNPMISGDEKFYNALQKIDWYYMNEKEEYRYVKKFIQSNDKVLEVGCGKGAFAKYIMAKNYIGLDFSKYAKELSAKNGITIKNEWIEDYAKKHKEEFDVVVSFQVLEHVSNPKEFIESKLLALKRGGKLIIAVPNENSFLKYVVNGILNLPPHHVTRWRDATFEFIARKYNLKILEIYHEKLQDIHKNYYFDTLISTSLFKNNKLIDPSLKRKIINKIISFFSKILVKGLKDEMLPEGHTTVVVFEKV